ncbi:FKBP-type peptidyl-prolyl cis-trans isomerase [Pedobacter hartonius]|uniref:peptidylprolyl isomerase n=1 Tax=Pedobacter hartonius TaxID=425514 RepID=A0A1H4HIF3_9SPHI|nr:FKBP-type peptidyl-prolyl cis-trans isomerase [Pedobacter hartonius]SEB21647.1 Domain amino terminal to FKBP-type peptidyl-prolyl isomerase [Pedobacter hartonius]
MKSKYILILAHLLIISSASAQSIKNLSIGDHLPDFVVKKIINYPKRSAKTSDFKNQLLILDFWATSCSGCVFALPKMEKLQKQFANKIIILPVTYESKSLTSSFWRSNKYTKNLKIPSVVEDKLFSTYFKHKTIPHEVWVYNGKVIAITTPDYVNAEQIKKVLTGEPINWPVKYDFYRFDGSKPLFATDTNQIDLTSTSLKYAAISDYKEGINSEGLTGGSDILRDSVKKIVRAYFLNQPIYTSYLLNWMIVKPMNNLVKPGILVAPNQIVWEVADRSKYLFDPKLSYQQEWIRKNGICFESVNPDTGQTDQQVHQTIISDLDRLLGLYVRWEKRKEKVWILRKLDGGKNKLQKKGTDKIEELSTGGLVYFLNQQENNPYVFDETGIDKKLPLYISSWTNLPEIAAELNDYGLKLEEQEREIDKLIFTEIDAGMLVDGQMQREFKAKRDAKINLTEIIPIENQTFLENNKKQLGIKVTTSGLQYKILKEGTGPKPVPGCKIVVHYTGALINGKIFDSSFENGKASIFPINDVIPGWMEALQLMNKGSKWMLYIPASLAYGTGTAHGKLPPNSTLIFELELLQILP